MKKFDNVAILLPELQGGGAERIASIIGNYYVEKGHNVYYFIGKNAGRSAYSIKGKIIYTEIVSGVGDFISLIKSAYIMRKYKRQYNISVSISFMEEFNYINVLSKGRDMVITRICTILSQRDELKDLLFYQDKVIRFFYNHADKIVVMTKYAEREMICRYGIRKKKLCVIPNPVQQMSVAIAQEDKIWQYGQSAVICVGRLENVKQHNIAIRVFTKVVKERPEAKLLIIGTGSNNNKLKKLILQLGLESSVFLLGFQKDVSYYLNNSKVFLMTSKTEGFPNSMIEAMSAGLPVVSTDNPAAREILGVQEKSVGRKINYGSFGIVTPCINHDFLWKEPLTSEENMLGEIIIKLLFDNGINQKYAESSKARASTYQLEKVMKQWNKIIEKEK